MKTITKITSIMLFASLTLIIPSCSRSDSETNTEKDAENRNDAKFGKADETDAQYVVDAYSDGILEIRMAERIRDRVESQDAKDLASAMITAHTKMNEDMRNLAAKKQISLPTDLTKSQQDDIDKIAEKTGNDLDQAYTDKVVSMHKDAVDLFTKASTKAADPEIRDAFDDGLPKIREHLDMAITAQAHVKK